MGRFEEGDDEEYPEEQINAGDAEIAGMHAVLQVQRSQGNEVGKLFEDGGKHHEAEADGIECDDNKGKLPGESEADEAVVKGGVGDGWRVIAADQVEYEVKRSEDQNAPDGGDPESEFGFLPRDRQVRRRRSTCRWLRGSSRR